MCQKHQVYKVYTIGDCYVALGFVDSTKRDAEGEDGKAREAVNVTKFCLSMIEIIGEVRKEINFPALNMRIGIHNGNVIGGIIGTDIVRYDIYGPDVLIANKMESEGVAGAINVSEATKNLVQKYYPDLYSYKDHQLVDIASLGCKIQSYLLSPKRPEEDAVVA